MKRIVWATDIHLDFVDDQQVESFCREIANTEPLAVLISGDIADALNLEKSLLALAGQPERPIYFVLGNHDFYGSSIAAVREKVEILPNLRIRTGGAVYGKPMLQPDVVVS